jgi:hypothetical protein
MDETDVVAAVVKANIGLGKEQSSISLGGNSCSQRDIISSTGCVDQPPAAQPNGSIQRVIEFDPFILMDVMRTYLDAL